MINQKTSELVILRGHAQQKRRPIQGPVFLIGGASDCDLVLGDPQFPQVHSCLMLREGGVWLRHLGFLPEITVNGTPASRVELADGDRIRTGPYEFRLSVRNPTRRDLTCSATATLPGRVLGLEPQSMTRDDAIAAVREMIAEVRADVIAEPQTLRLFKDLESGDRSRPIHQLTLPAASIPIARRVRRA